MNGSWFREKLTFYGVRDLRSKVIIIFIRLPDSRTETRHVVLSGTSRVHSDGAGHRGGIDVTRMTIQLRVSAVEDDLIHCRTPLQSPYTSQCLRYVAVHHQRRDVLSVATPREDLQGPGSYRICVGITGSSSNWILMSCQPHRVTSGQSNSGHKQIHISKLF